MNQAPRITPTAALMLGALAFLWGGSFFFVEVALAEVPPLTVVLHRVIWAVPILWLVLRWKRLTVPRDARFWGAAMVMGALNNALPFSLIFWGQVRIEGGLAAILNGSTAVFAAVVAGLLLRDEALSSAKIGGAALGLAGVAVVLGADILAGFDPADLAQIAVLAGALSYAFAGVWGRLHLAGTAPEVNAFGMLCCSVVLMMPVALLADGLPRLDLSAPVWAALLALSVASTALGYMLYFGILQRAGAANLLLVTLLIPPVAVALGATWLGEQMPPGAGPGFALISLGLLVSDGRVLARARAVLARRRA